MSHSYCSLEDARTELVRAVGSTTVDDGAISERLPRAAAVIDEFCEHSFNAATVVDEQRRGEAVAMDNNGRLQITAAMANVRTLTAASITADFQTWYALDVSRCDVDAYVLTFYGVTAPVGRNSRLVARLSYEGGYDPIPDLLRHCAARVTAFLFMVRNAPFEVTAFPSVGQVTIPAKLPPDVGAALAHSKFKRARV